MDFGVKWFDELRRITEAQLLASRDSTYKAARLHTLANFPRNLHDNANALVRAVDCKRFPFNEFFRVLRPGHAFTYSKGGYLRRQWYMGFTSGDGSGDEVAFLGFAIKIGNNPEGLDDWRRFIEMLKSRQADFRDFFENNLNWIEMGGEHGGKEMIDKLIEYTPNGDDWIFIGRRYSLSGQNGVVVLSTVDSMAAEARSTFDCLARSGFTAGL